MSAASVVTRAQAILGQRAATGDGDGDEGVPWRLTRELLDALGPTGSEGMYSRCCEHALRVIQSDGAREELRCLLETFVDQPLAGWRAGAAGGAGSSGADELPDKVDAEVALLRAKQRLTGSDEGGALSVESRVLQLVQQATDASRLMLMPVEWQPWL